METLNNSNPIGEIVALLPNIKNKIDETTNQMNEYLDGQKDEKFEEKENEEIEETINRAEGIYDRLDEIIRRRVLVLNKGKQTIDLIDNLKLKIEEVVKSCENDGIPLEKANDELIDKIIDLEERKRKRDITPLQQQIDEINRKFKYKKSEWEGNLSKRKKEELRKQEEEKIKRMNTIIDNNEMKQIETWSGMKIGNIIFDSDVDNWNQNTSVFDQRILNKSNLIFIIEDEDDNKFGRFINAKIDRCNSHLNDSKSFVFSLKSNGRLNGMFKFDIIHKQYALYLFDSTEDRLTFIGGGNGDIVIWKENNKNNSHCKQTSFNYNGVQNALCGKQNFTPKRITAIQLI